MSVDLIMSEINLPCTTSPLSEGPKEEKMLLERLWNQVYQFLVPRRSHLLSYMRSVEGLEGAAASLETFFKTLLVGSAA